jgi:hypothetical protein
MTQRSKRRRTIRVNRQSGPARPGRRNRLPALVGRQIDDLYLQLDDQLTRMARIQLQFDRLRSRLRLL